MIRVLALMVYAGAALWLFWGDLPHLLRRWSTEDYSYCWLVLPLALYLGWERWREGRPFCRPSPWLGYACLALTLGLYWLGRAGAMDSLVFAAMWATVLAAVLLSCGRRWAWAFKFPLLVLAFAVPPPPMLNRLLTFRLRLVSSRLAENIMHWLDITAFREGNVIDLGFLELHVVDACSGLRYVLPTLLIGLLAGHFLSRGVWRKVVVLALSAPVAVAANALRIAATGFLARHVSVETAEAFFHDVSGIAVYVLGLCVLLAAALLLNRVGPRSEPSQPPPRMRIQGPSLLAEEVTARYPVHLLLAALVLAGAVFAQKPLLQRTEAPERLPFSVFPSRIGDYRGASWKFSEEVEASLGADDYLTAAYRNPQTRRKIYMLISWYARQAPLRSAHNPVSCLLGGGGWSLAQDRTLPPSPAQGRDFSVGQLVLEKPGSRLLVYWWFEQAGRVVANEVENKMLLAYRALKSGRTDG
ncbi:MAG: exosortase C-terminal domain/associated protein EpsI, partial [Desulfovibrionaceae bacterium]